MSTFIQIPSNLINLASRSKFIETYSYLLIRSQIKDNSYIDSVFKIVSKGKNIQEFFVEDASLNEIFVNVVGENYE